jgi:hypothetical protein
MRKTMTGTSMVKQTNQRRRELAGRKLIKCPFCTELLMDVDRHTKVELFRLPIRKHKLISYEKLKHCDHCKGKVGYNLIITTEV